MKKLSREEMPPPGALAAMAVVCHIDWVMDLLPDELEQLRFMRLMVGALGEMVEKKEEIAANKIAKKRVIQ